MVDRSTGAAEPTDGSSVFLCILFSICSFVRSFLSTDFSVTCGIQLIISISILLSNGIHIRGGKSSFILCCGDILLLNSRFRYWCSILDIYVINIQSRSLCYIGIPSVWYYRHPISDFIIGILFWIYGYHFSYRHSFQLSIYIRSWLSILDLHTIIGCLYRNFLIRIA